MYFHGSGGLGKDLDRVADEPLLELLESDDGFRFILISPQLPEGFWPKYFERIDHLITDLVRQLNLDEGRMYLTGFSLGGVGAWRFAMSFPNRFAAVAPVAGAPSVSGGFSPEEICDLKELPMWVFHSEADSAITAQFDIDAVETLKACGGIVIFSRYSDLNHVESAFEAYSDPDLYDWLLEQSAH